MALTSIIGETAHVYVIQDDSFNMFSQSIQNFMEMFILKYPMYSFKVSFFQFNIFLFRKMLLYQHLF